jgi:hypothetical protein
LSRYSDVATGVGNLHERDSLLCSNATLVFRYWKNNIAQQWKDLSLPDSSVGQQ